MDNNQMNGNNNNNNNNNNRNNKNGQMFLAFLLVSLVMLFIMSYVNSKMDQMSSEEITYSRFLKMVEEDKVESVEIGSSEIKITPKEEKKDTKVNNGLTTIKKTYYTGIVENPDLLKTLEKHDVNIKGTIPDNTSVWIYNILSFVIPLVLVWVLLGFLMRRMGGGGVMGVGKSNAKVYVEKQTGVTFKDVAGEDEAKESLQEVVDFLHNPKRYTEIGAKLPKGALLVGPPGTGKTLLAKAVAGEAGVPFFSISGSDFVEMFVGVGASRVRDLFKEAKSQAPSIIFIDEIDAVGRQRGAGLGGGHDEREQTLNQLLVEMDGFEESESVILIAATNRPDILDPALLRPGRFDRQVTVDRPDVKGREQILRVHAENKPMDEDVKFEKLAQMTVGFTGADLANLLNESALLAARRHRSVISMDEVEESMERVIAGPQRKGRVMTEAERTTIAYHESGHALVGHILEHSDPVHKISIVSRGQALGYTLQLPQEDHFLKTKNEMLDELAVFLGGRVAEELMCDDITSGASNDLERATKMAREMVTRLGMSEELGTQVFGEAQHQVFLGRDYADHQDYSEETARRIDIEVQRIMREAHRRAVEILDARRDQLDLMAKVLLERETVEGDAVNALLDNDWDAYLEREGDILAAKEERNAKAAGVPTKKRAPRMSEEELAADAAAFARAAMQEDAEVASDSADDVEAADTKKADGDTEADE